MQIPHKDIPRLRHWRPTTSGLKPRRSRRKPSAWIVYSPSGMPKTRLRSHPPFQRSGGSGKAFWLAVWSLNSVAPGEEILIVLDLRVIHLTLILLTASSRKAGNILTRKQKPIKARFLLDLNGFGRRLRIAKSIR